MKIPGEFPPIFIHPTGRYRIQAEMPFTPPLGAGKWASEAKKI